METTMWSLTKKASLVQTNLYLDKPGLRVGMLLKVERTGEILEVVKPLGRIISVKRGAKLSPATELKAGDVLIELPKTGPAEKSAGVIQAEKERLSTKREFNRNYPHPPKDELRSKEDKPADEEIDGSVRLLSLAIRNYAAEMIGRAVNEVVKDILNGGVSKEER